MGVVCCPPLSDGGPPSSRSTSRTLFVGIRYNKNHPY